MTPKHSLKLPSHHADTSDKPCAWQTHLTCNYRKTSIECVRDHHFAKCSQGAFLSWMGCCILKGKSRLVWVILCGIVLCVAHTYFFANKKGLNAWIMVMAVIKEIYRVETVRCSLCIYTLSRSYMGKW